MVIEFDQAMVCMIPSLPHMSIFSAFSILARKVKQIQYLGLVTLGNGEEEEEEETKMWDD